MNNNNLQFNFNGDSKDFNKVSCDATWLLKQAVDKNINEIEISITDGSEKNYIQGLLIDVFSGTDINLKFK